ncbi:MAG: CapA family protein [Clostridiales bacterium]|nr:CapA family protein [Clostridiales bacterium]
MKKITLCLALAVCLSGLFLLPGCGQGSSPADESEPGTELSAAADTLSEDSSEESEISGSVTEVTEPEILTLTITATGDCTLGVTQDQSYEGSFTEYYNARGEDYFFDDLRCIFESDYFTLINLECVLTTATERVEKTFNLKGAPEYVGILTGSSVEAASMGNNHTYDYGEEGFQETKQVLEEAGITYAYSDQSGTYVTDDGVTVGMVSANLLSQSEEKLDTLKEQIAALREEGADVIIACCHWGIEKDYYPSDYQQTTAHELIDAGADLVIGNHPHVLQGVEVYEGKVICYSLGNFCFGGNKNPSDKNTMIFQQTFTIADGVVQTDEIDANIIPCRVSSANGYNDYQPTVAEGDTKQNIISLVNGYSSPFGNVSFDEEGTLLYSE